MNIKSDAFITEIFKGLLVKKVAVDWSQRSQNWVGIFFFVFHEGLSLGFYF